MTVNREYFVDVFGDIVDKVQTLYDTDNAEKPYYEYGHILDIVDKLIEKTESSTYKLKKYPLICLLQDFTETKGTDPRIEYTVSPTVLILTNTEDYYHSEHRYVQNFKTILYPIYYHLLTALDRSSHLWKPESGQWEHDKTDRVYWGNQGLYGSEGHVFNDKVDAIELNFKNIEIKEKLNC